ncbi:MAG: SGNH/GDSL hydrolase family protein [Gracilimonas sp.]|nr:SGNH/GDSL hydrolase family protein [Gracilimonas sp.]
MKFYFTNPIIQFLVIIFSLIVGSCSQIKAQNINSDQIPAIRYLALGDSYTIGTGIDSLHNYPNQISDSLQTRGIAVDTTSIIATNGWTTSDLKQGIMTQSPDSTYTLVSLLIGVNNQYQGLNLDIYQKEFKQLLENAIALAGGIRSNVLVISIPNYGVTPFGQSRNPVVIRQELQVYNDIAKKISVGKNIPFVNITPASELAKNDPSLLASDDLHPSAKMYAMWVEEMLPTIIKILSNE